MEIHLSQCKRCPPSIGHKYLVRTSSKKSLLCTEQGRERYQLLKKTAVFEDEEEDEAAQADQHEEKIVYPAFVDHITAVEQEKCERALVKAVFVTGRAMSMFEHPLWKKALSTLRPAFKIPPRHKIDSYLLDREYNEMNLIVDEKILNCDRLTLQLDGWSNIRNEGITNILVGTPIPFLTESIESKEKSQDHKYYVDCASKVMEKYEPKKFVGLVTDNGGPMKLFRSKMKEKYDWLIEYPCAMHCIQLLISSIIQLPTCAAVTKSAKDVIKAIKRSHKLNATFSRIRKEKKIKTGLHLPGKTIFGSHVKCFESLIKCKVALQSLAIDTAVNDVLSNDHRALLLDNEKFWTNIQLLLDLIKPMLKWITILESDEPRFHLVVEAFDDIISTLNEKLTDSPLENDEIYQLEERMDELYKECVKDAHLAANRLHPTTQGKKLSIGQIDTAMEFLEAYAEKIGILDVEDVSCQAIEFKTHSGPWSSKYIWNCSSKMDPIIWWSKVCPETKLQQVALNLLSLAATTGPTERSFSAQGRVHSKPKNRLLTPKAAKLTYIAFNTTILIRKPKLKDDDLLKLQAVEEHSKDNCDKDFEIVTDSDTEYDSSDDSDVDFED